MSAVALPLEVAILVSVICQAIVYGMFLVLFGATCYVLTQKKKTTTTNVAFLATACTMFVFITINFAVSWSRIMDALFHEANPTAYLGDLTQWKEVFRTGVYIALTAVADSLFIYRLYMVWSRNIWICILPMLLLAGSLTSGIGIEVAIASLKGSGLFASGIAAWATSFFSISLAQNVLTTLLIVWRIWRVNLGAGHLGSNSLWPVIAVILESGALYSANLLCLLATYASGSFAQYICLDILVPNIGCTFCLIIVRVGLGLSKSGSQQAPTQEIGRATIGGTSARYPMRKININVARTVDVDQEDVDIERGGKEGSETDVDVFDKSQNMSYEQMHGSNAF
ncbi:hypothetical protein DACRYDRAFT_25603 [Dacryopinax primogenitus]|uniref:Family A G protein-coupled receptor-like protein n=1 Tax=Dacryopinax primogenitus (strain DJM 731) TaxID=1858805 RepID=M5FPS4_DACPD|nr:uncharacterized protein DACRYDRAFT_25603 [Dacryopinax primogenitus]EJT96574.1 hypothetical protein DACRYDRAFT_25603 [Dacryopinax primogenitus]